MNKKLLFLIFLSTVLIVTQATAILDAESANLEVNLELPVEFKVSEDGFLKYLNIEFVMNPVNDTRQEVLSSTYNIEPERVEKSVAYFKITEPENFVLKANFEVETEKKPRIINEKIDFPIQRIDPFLNNFLEETTVFDINNEINSLAISLAYDEDDLYKVVFKIADWVNKNIEYDLETLSQKELPSSWVIKNKKGVCTEYTALFVSMTRSLGIPSREVSGIAYTDSELFDTGWGFHSWAEVYFPNHGWIPFDPTYGQYGFVSASHIKLGINSDAESRRNSFSWQGRNIEVKPKETELNVNINSKIDSQKKSKITVKTDLLEKEVGSNSYNMIQFDLKNNNDFYIVETLRFSGVDGLIFHTPQIKNLILAPWESKTIYNVFELEKELNRGFQYTFPLRFYLNNELFSEEFKARVGSTIVSRDDISIFLEKETLSKEALICEATPIIRANNKLNVGCETDEEGIVCFENICKEVEQSITSFYVNMTEPGLFTKTVTFENDNEKKVSFIKFLVIDEVSVSLSSEHSKKLTPQNTGFIDFFIKKESSTTPKNVSIMIIHDYFKEEQFIGDIDDELHFNFAYRARNLKKGTNEILLKVIYYDALGKKFSDKLIVEVELEGLSFLDEIDFFFRRLFYWFKNLG